MLSGPFVPVMVSVSFATTAVADGKVAPECDRPYAGAAPAVPAAPKLAAKTAAEATLRWRALTSHLIFMALYSLDVRADRCRSGSRSSTRGDACSVRD